MAARERKRDVKEHHYFMHFQDILLGHFGGETGDTNIPKEAVDESELEEAVDGPGGTELRDDFIEHELIAQENTKTKENITMELAQKFETAMSIVHMFHFINVTVTNKKEKRKHFYNPKYGVTSIHIISLHDHLDMNLHLLHLQYAMILYYSTSTLLINL
ncbi:hypothetical protein ACJX0J_020508, partial [Zea mays]